MLEAPRILAVGLLAGFLFAAEPRVDLDVAIPPGSPLDWAQSLPSHTPGGKPIFPETQERRRPNGGGKEENRTRSVPASTQEELDVRTLSSFGIVRVLTWDIYNHLLWVRGHYAPRPTTGKVAPYPEPGHSLYWISLAPLLRLMLHPDVVSEAEVLAHLVEIGEPVLGVLEAAGEERTLREPVMWLRTYIQPGRDGPAEATKGASPRETMLRRFVLDELYSAHPYDPAGSFGERLFLLGDEVQPILAGYAREDAAFVRRNAVAALGRYRTRYAIEEMLELAAESDDPVVQVRALSAIGRFRSSMDWSILVRKLEKTGDPMKQCAIIGALGRVGYTGCAPELCRIGEKAVGKDSDVLIAVLAALARMHHTEHTAVVDEFADRIDELAAKDPKALRPDKRQGGPAPDRADAMETRAEIAGQLALIVRARLAPENDALVRRLIQLREPLLKPEDVGPYRVLATNDTLRDVHPPVRFLYLETLGLFGAKGAEALKMIVADRTTETALRGHALRHVPWDDRIVLCKELLSDPAESTAIRIQAFEVAADAQHPDLAALGKEILAQCAAAEPWQADAELRYLWLTTVHALSERKLLSAADLMPLLKHPRRTQDAFANLPDELRLAAAELVRMAERGEQKARLREKLDPLLDEIVRLGANPRVTEATKGNVRRDVLLQIAGAKAHKGDVLYQQKTVDLVLEILLGFPPPRIDRRQGEFEIRVPLEEEILLALGRTKEPQAAELLMAFLANRKSRHTPVALLALGMTGQRSAASAFPSFLLEEDPFVRFCAYESLRHVTGEDVFVDWMYGPSSERFAAAEKYWKIVVEGKR